MISCAVWISSIAPDAWPISSGIRSICASKSSSPPASLSSSACLAMGRMPLAVSARISSWRLSSQFTVGSNALRQQRLSRCEQAVAGLTDEIVLLDAHRAAREDDRAHGVVVVSAEHLALVARRRAGLRRGDEPRADPHGRGAEGQRHRQPAAVEDAAGADDVDRAAVQR